MLLEKKLSQKTANRFVDYFHAVLVNLLPKLQARNSLKILTVEKNVVVDFVASLSKTTASIFGIFLQFYWILQDREFVK